MQKHHERLRIGGIVVALLLLTVTFPGCAKITVQCPPAGTSQDGATGCYPPTAYAGSADGFWNDDTSDYVPPGSGLMCQSGSNKCKAIPGSCLGKACLNHYSGGYCYCGCPPTM
jgi:hypothetical protein